MLPLNLRLWGAIGSLVLLTSTYLYGSHVGSSKVTRRWEAEKNIRKGIEANQARVIELNGLKHSRESKLVNEELKDVKEKYAKAVSDLGSEHSSRMLLSRERANYYSKQAQAGTIEARGLADHAARLDTSLEEGRYLVVELRQSLLKREEELRLLGQQIKADRNVLD